MSHSTHDAAHGHPSHYNTGSGGITKVGGALGIAASLVGFAIFLAGCAGFNAAFKFALIPMLLAVAGLLLTIIGGATKKTAGSEDTHIVAALMLNLASIMGALILIAVWRGIPVFAGGAV